VVVAPEGDAAEQDEEPEDQRDSGGRSGNQRQHHHRGGIMTRTDRRLRILAAMRITSPSRGSMPARRRWA
jgi:hypothetical protein